MPPAKSTFCGYQYPPRESHENVQGSVRTLLPYGNMMRRRLLKALLPAILGIILLLIGALLAVSEVLEIQRSDVSSFHDESGGYQIHFNRAVFGVFISSVGTMQLAYSVLGRETPLWLVHEGKESRRKIDAGITVVGLGTAMIGFGIGGVTVFQGVWLSDSTYSVISSNDYYETAVPFVVVGLIGCAVLAYGSLRSRAPVLFSLDEGETSEMKSVKAGILLIGLGIVEILLVGYLGSTYYAELLEADNSSILLPWVLLGGWLGLVIMIAGVCYLLGQPFFPTYRGRLHPIRPKGNNDH